MRIVYFGTAQFAVAALKALLANPARFEVVGVVTQPDKPAGRDGSIAASPVAKVAREAGLPLMQFTKMKAPETAAELAALDADVFVVAAYGRIIPKALLDLPKHGCINLHGSLLPKYRGASPIQAAIAAGETETGVTLMGMDEEVDHGPAYATAVVPIDHADTYDTLEAKLADASGPLLIDNLEDVVSGVLKPIPQEHDKATFTGIIGRHDGFISWKTLGAAAIEHRRRAYTPWPGIYAVWMRKGAPLRLKLLDVTVTQAPSDAVPGTVFKDTDGSPAVVAASGAIRLLSVQPEGKKPLDGKTLLNGYQDLIGSKLENEETPA